MPLATSIADPLPPIRGDRERLRQVLANLVENAVKYSPGGRAGGGERLGARTANVVVTVARPRAGYRERRPVADLREVRPRASGKAKPGTGLGLFIARSIAEAHGGTLDVRSAPAEGATFTLVLPTGLGG